MYIFFTTRMYFIRILRLKFTVTGEGGAMGWGLIAGGGEYRLIHTVFPFLTNPFTVIVSLDTDK